MSMVTRVADKAGALGTIVSAMSCPACFPAIASLGAAIGLGFLNEYEGLFMTTLLPLFAVMALAANTLGWFSHRQWLRSTLGMTGPAMVIAASYFFLGNWWTADLLYAGLGGMVVVSLWDLLAPAHKRCSAKTCSAEQTGIEKAGGLERNGRTVMLDSVLTCPHCGFAKRETMLTDACLFFYECEQCKASLRPKPGDCCVFCSYGSEKCPPVQQANGCCGATNPFMA